MLSMYFFDTNLRLIACALALLAPRVALMSAYSSVARTTHRMNHENRPKVRPEGRFS